MKSMRGQSAIEYLTTYGWAILLLVIVIGGLFASGVLTPSYFISEECYLGPDLSCKFQVYKDNDNPQLTKIKINISNGFAYPIKITDFKITSSEDETITSTFGSLPSPILPPTASYSDALDMNQPSQLNSMKKYKVSIKYQSCAAELLAPGKVCSDVEHEISGRIIGLVLEKTS